MTTKKNLLFVTSRIPAPGIYGDQLRSWRFLVSMAERFDITLLCLDDGRIAEEDLERVTEKVASLVLIPHSKSQSISGALYFLAGGKPAQVGWFHSSRLAKELEKLVATGNYDGAFLQMARLHSVLPALHPLPITLDFVDALSLQWHRRRNTGSPVHRLFNRVESERMMTCERDILHSCQATLVTGRDDAMHLESLSDLAIDVNVVPNGVDMDSFHPLSEVEAEEIRTADRQPVVLFSGNLDYLPNRNAVQFFAEKVLPLLKEKRPEVRFIAAGKVTNAELLSLAETHGVEFTGFVDDLGKEIASADVVVAPMVDGAGIQNKVLEAMATGTPVVSTRLANAGIKAAHGKEILIGGSPETLTGHILSLLRNPARAAQIGAAGRQFVSRKFSWDAQAGVVADHMEEISSVPITPRATLNLSKGPVRNAALNQLHSNFTNALFNVEGKVFRTLTRLLHVSVSILILMGFALVLPLVALMIKLDSSGPIFYSQQRVGIDRRRPSGQAPRKLDRRVKNQGGRIFTIWKLRSMRQDAEKDTGPVWAQKQDSRITSVGKFLRKSRLDEIPQLWNVLRGEMSLVGPRPERPLFVEELARHYPGYRTRLAGCKPGITGLAQVQGSYDTAIEKVGEKLLLDHGYRLQTQDPRHHFLTDLKVILQTFPTVVSGKGAH